MRICWGTEGGAEGALSFSGSGHDAELPPAEPRAVGGPLGEGNGAMDVEQVVEGFVEAFRAAGTRERAEQEKRYLKSDLEFFGVTVPAIRRELGAFTGSNRGIGRAEVLGVVGRMWAPFDPDAIGTQDRRPVHELRMGSVLLLEGFAGMLLPDDAALIERMIRESKTWAYVDNLAASVMGPLVEANPGLMETLDRWAEDEDFWVRRSAMLALLLPLREGRGDLERFFRYADSMLDEREFFIRKAIGWVLRETSKKRPAEVREYLASRIGRVSGLTLREGAKRLPEGEREALLEAYRAR